MTRTLNGEGEVVYDYKYDMLYYRTKGRDYSHSIDMHGLVADVDEDGFVTGATVEDASSLLGVPKYALKNIQGATFRADVDEESVTVEIALRVMIRNRSVKTGMMPENFRAQFVQAAPAGMKRSLVTAQA